MVRQKSSTPSDDSSRGRLSEDQKRDKEVYLYLLKNLTDWDDTERPNESSIAKQWGMEDNRIFVRRVLRSVQSHFYEDESKKTPTVPGLTLGKLVKILSSLGRYWSDRKRHTSRDRIPRIISRGEKLTALRKLSQLAIEERDALKLKNSLGEALLQKLEVKLLDPISGLQHEAIARLYKTALSQLADPINREVNGKKLQEKEIKHLIEETVKTSLKPHLEKLSSDRRKEKVKEFVIKVKREINRIEFQAGLKQVKSFLGEESEINYSVKYLTSDFIKHLTQSIINNEILTDEFPISLKNFIIEKTEPLPLYVKKEGRAFSPKIGLLNSHLLDTNEDPERIGGLERQSSYKTSVNFYIKLPKNYRPKIINSKDLVNLENEQRLEFCEEIRGVGSPLSHVTEAINRFLLLGVPAVNSGGSDYFTIARDILKKSEFIGGDNHSLIWSHIVVELCQRDEINKALREETSYNNVLKNHEIACGEYCGFDMVEVVTRAAFMARLRAIQQTGVNSKQYIDQLCLRVEQYRTLKEAKNLIKFYPFSLKAMEGKLEEKILNTYRTRDEDFNFLEEDSEHSWSLVAYEAHMSIAEAYLKEGLYRIAKKYLDILKHHLEKFGKQIFSEFTLAKYSICWFRYHYLTDLEDVEKPHPDRLKAVRTALDCLNKAEQYLKDYLKICYIIDELPQSNFSPFFYFLCRIYAHRAKLYIFHSSYTELFSDPWETLLKPIQLLEQARIYAARDGDSDRYAYWCAYQAWCYLMVVYLGDYERSQRSGFSKQECLDWAKRLIDHALICYAPTGQRCYQEIKDRGGSVENSDSAISSDAKASFYERYGETQIQVIPLIQESRSMDKQYYDRENHILHLDLSILRQNIDNVQVYLFGTHSSILLFAMGMFELCGEQENEQELHKNIEKAIRIFTYCWAIAEDGGIEETETKVIERNFAERENRDTLLQGLYLHRLTQFADLGKIFEVTCRTILLLCNRGNSSWDSIFPLVDTLLDNPCDPSGNAIGQKRYNGNLAEHYKQFQHYIHQLSQEKQYSSNIIEVRDRIVRKVFKIIRGET